MRIILLIAFMHATLTIYGQVEGLWEVRRVTVGNDVMTPTGKWVRLEDGKQTTGNGSIEHTYGSYQFNKKTSALTLITENDPNEDFGPFTVTKFGANAMTWIRIEEGQTVTVELTRIRNLPVTPADAIHGLWDLERAMKGNEDITNQLDPQSKYWMFVRWDRIYQISTGTERINGYWYINAHQPELRLMRFGREQEEDKWEVSFVVGKLVLLGISDSNKDQVLTFGRLTQFPKP